jgi:hypothetical protein
MEHVKEEINVYKLNERVKELRFNISKEKIFFKMKFLIIKT